MTLITLEFIFRVIAATFLTVPVRKIFFIIVYDFRPFPVIYTLWAVIKTEPERKEAIMKRSSLALTTNERRCPIWEPK